MSFEKIFLWLFGVAAFFTILYFVIYNAVKDAILSASEAQKNGLEESKDEPIPKVKCANCGVQHDFDCPKCPNCGH